MTITDSSPGQTGTISNTYNTTINEVISNGAKLTFKAGNIRNQYSEGIKNSGQLNVTGGTIITKEDAIFNNQGQRVDNPGKGLYIRNGRVVVIK